MDYDSSTKLKHRIRMYAQMKEKGKLIYQRFLNIPSFVENYSENEEIANM